MLDISIAQLLYVCYLITTFSIFQIHLYQTVQNMSIDILYLTTFSRLKTLPKFDCKEERESGRGCLYIMSKKVTDMNKGEWRRERNCVCFTLQVVEYFIHHFSDLPV